MRIFAAFIPALLFAGGPKIDHATVAGHDIQALQKALASIGIASAYGGTHTNGSTEMAIASFPDGSYLELMALRPSADPAVVERHVWAKFLKGDAGPCAFAVRSDDIAAEIARLRAAGVTVSDPSKMGRTRSDGARLEWEMADIGPGTRGSFFPFIIHDFTPRQQRVGKPANRDFPGIQWVVIAVNNLDQAIERYRNAYAGTAPVKQVDKEFGAHLAEMPGLSVVLAEPLTADSWLAARLNRFGEAPCAFVLAGANTRKYIPASKTRWFAEDVAWFDPGQLGWRLGFVPER
jgi:hypothetical protein